MSKAKVVQKPQEKLIMTNVAPRNGQKNQKAGRNLTNIFYDSEELWNQIGEIEFNEPIMSFNDTDYKWKQVSR